MNVFVGIHNAFAIWTIPRSYVERLVREFPEHSFIHAESPDTWLRGIEEADVAFSAQLTPEHLARGSRLRWVHSPAAGIGAMLFPAMVASRVILTNSRGISADTIAEHVIAVTLALVRKLPLAVRAQGAREWVQQAIASPPPIRLIAGSRVLVVGLGSIGVATSKLFAALGARVTAIRRNTSAPRPEGVDAVYAPDRLRDLLPSADVVLICAPQTSETQHLIGGAELAAMSSQSVLVNVSRGNLVDEDALASALGARRIGGAALDVFDTEPLPQSSPLWTLPNVLITPHSAG
ncbi:MAG: D-2-hydroxyacid dehydrogenase, partial [Acidobacteria bacterium]|nr:D-2-hydroxyacid dehydrogenase [Acidobacteriota bacterium]